MSLMALIAYRWLSLAGVHVAALALSAGVVAEAAASRVMTTNLVREMLRQGRVTNKLMGLTLGGFVRFYVPLALTSLLAMAVPPMVTFYMGQSRHALESLAVLPVVHGLTFMFRAIGLSYLEVVVALLGDQREHIRAVLRFGAVVGVVAAMGLGLIGFTPLVSVWFEDVSGLTPLRRRCAVRRPFSR